MRKQLMTGLVVALAAGYSAGALAASGNIGSGPFGTDNFMLTLTSGNPGAGGKGPGSFAATMSRIFYGGVELHFDLNNLLVTPDGTPFTGTTTAGDTYKDGKKV